MSRRKARETAFKLIFEYSFSKQENKDLFEEYTAGISGDESSYISEVYFGVISHYDELEKLVAETAEKFEVKRLYKVDFALIMLALYEIKYMSSIPFKVSVDEALDLASKYSTEKSVKYINGVLSKFVR